MLKQTEILAAVIKLLKDKLKMPIYADEIQEGFKTPCLFVKLVKRVDTETINFNACQLSIIITYMASAQKSREIEFLGMVDDIYMLFGLGFKIVDRYLPTKTITSERIGEKQDILQVTLTYEYLDSTDRPSPEYDLIEKLNVNEKLRAD